MPDNSGEIYRRISDIRVLLTEIWLLHVRKENEPDSVQIDLFGTSGDSGNESEKDKSKP
jgi:hypothetical protein